MSPKWLLALAFSGFIVLFLFYYAFRTCCYYLITIVFAPLFEALVFVLIGCPLEEGRLF